MFRLYSLKATLPLSVRWSLVLGFLPMNASHSFALTPSNKGSVVSDLTIS